MGDAARVLLAAGEAGARDHLSALLRTAGFLVIDDPAAGPPAAIVAVDPAGWSVPRGEERPPLVAIVRDDDEAAAALEAGVDDVVRVPVSAGTLARHLHRQLSAAADRAAAARNAQILVEIGRLAVAPSAVDAPGTVRAILELVHESFPVSAVAVLAAHDPPWRVEVHVGDAVPRQPHRRMLADLPEARAALALRRIVALGAIALEGVPRPTPELALARRAVELREEGVMGLAVVPLEWRGRAAGALFLTTSSPLTLSVAQVAFVRVVADVLAGVIGASAGGAGVGGVEVDRTQKLNLARHAEEQRLRAIERFQSYFQAASDGIVVVDRAGVVLFVNHTAEVITGFARDSLVGRPLADLVPPEQRSALTEVVAQVLGGSNLEAFDLAVATTSGDRLTVSVATSTVLAEHGAAILSFRDVTPERLLEAELRKTKEFLEKLIDSTVDAIIAADRQGKVVLFNPGAERLFGWRADQVIGVLTVDQLYPPGVARQIMRMLRSPSYGGVGRLELTRREIVTKDDEIIPVNMTASTIYEDGREVATVGVLSDLRDRIRIEQRLLQAQEKLLITEKQAVVAELAGAAAHELNQPLTSVMLYLEMMQKKMPPDDPSWRAVQALSREAERMAEIVKKIGRITKYETKQYVGSASILDLEKASGEPDPPAEPGSASGRR